MRIVWDLPLSPDGVLVELDGGKTVRIRPIRPSDKDALVAAFDRLSLRSRYQRFFTAMARLPDGLATSLTDIDHVAHLAWAVADPEATSEVADQAGLAIGAARIMVDQDDPTQAEAALALVDDYQRQGIGKFLIELLVHTASQIGVKSLLFEVLAENRGMRALLVRLGAEARAVPGDRTVQHYVYPVPPADEVDSAAGPLYELLRRLPEQPGDLPS